MKRVIKIEEENCVNCHRCISVCPIKFCNDGSKDVITLNSELCIGCGECLIHCHHNARHIIDDLELALHLLNNKEKLIAFIAPSAAANFPNQYLKLNGWLKSKGVDAFFDVSFGAELAIKSYVEYIKEYNPKLVISQPCPPIVKYIEIYRKELLPYLANVQSPMLHSILMVKKYYPEYSNHKIIVVSPCITKSREFDDNNIEALNVTIANLQDYFTENNIDLNDFEEIDFNNSPAERAVSFSSPGGLLATLEREIPGINFQSRKIEGPSEIYPYLDNLAKNLESIGNPLLIDCLNCKLGCNGGTGTHSQNKSPDELEFHINQRRKTMELLYKEDIINREEYSEFSKLIEKYWNSEDYKREYDQLIKIKDESLKLPDDEKLNEIYLLLRKTEKSDFKNCRSCGYDTCEQMATAIYNGLNKVDNCHVFLNKLVEEKNKELSEAVEKTNKELVKKNREIEKMLIFQTDANMQLAKLERDKNYFISLLAHELNTPLNAINGFANILRGSLEDEELIEFCNYIIESGNRLKRFADLSMLITNLKTNNFALKKITHSASYILLDSIYNLKDKAQEKNIEIKLDIRDEELTLYIDPNLIQKVIEIALDNAVKFSYFDSKIIVRYYVSYNIAHIEIEDFGVGFNKDAMASMFKFFTSDNIMQHSEGLGLGLAVAKIIMDSHESEIEILNKESGGALIKLLFDLDQIPKSA